MRKSLVALGAAASIMLAAIAPASAQPRNHQDYGPNTVAPLAGLGVGTAAGVGPTTDGSLSPEHPRSLVQ